jgi:transcription elongation factor GreA-like protein
MVPLKFTLESDMTETFSIWKIFLTKRRIDISSLKQQSVFRERVRNFAAKDEKIVDPEWGSISVVVLQKSNDLEHYPM